MDVVCCNVEKLEIKMSGVMTNFVPVSCACAFHLSFLFQQVYVIVLALNPNEGADKHGALDFHSPSFHS